MITAKMLQINFLDIVKIAVVSRGAVIDKVPMFNNETRPS